MRERLMIITAQSVEPTNSHFSRVAGSFENAMKQKKTKSIALVAAIVA
jgi:hypothetical protein